MTKEALEKELSALIVGSIKELFVSKEVFSTFREIWVAHPQKERIVGEAQLGGTTIYRYLEEKK